LKIKEVERFRPYQRIDQRRNNDNVNYNQGENQYNNHYNSVGDERENREPSDSQTQEKTIRGTEYSVGKYPL
jgi:hypothetical protein